MRPDFQTLKATLAQKAAELGFALFGVALPDYSPAELAIMRAWTDAGYAADMHYLATRRDLVETDGLGAVLPNLRCVIMLGLPYRHAGHSDPDGPRGRASLYATGRDYHRAIESRQKALIRLLVEHGDTPRAYVDHGPVWERLLAWKAGLGFIGKNGCLINPEFGSYVFLGAILSTLPLPIDTPHPGQCADSCTRCLRACPTQALVRPCVVDSRRCIAYHTVENRQDIPIQLRPKMGRWILGCDQCQLCCPYNRQAPFTDLPDFQGQRLSRRPELSRFWELDEESFRARFLGNAAMRPGRARMARNAAIAAGNHLAAAKETDAKLIARIESALLRETEPVVREALHWALAQAKRTPTPHDTL